ncbi:MAG: ATP-binding protein [Vicingaceae bacterium]
MPDQAIEFNKENVEHIPCIVLTVDSNGVVKYMNQYASKILGYQVEEVVGNRFFEVFTPDIGQDKAKEDLKQIKKGVSSGAKFFNWSQTKDGKKIYIEWRISYIPTKGKEVLRFAVFGIDTTTEYYVNLIDKEKGRLAYDLSSSTTLNELLKYSIRSISVFAQFEFGLAFKVDGPSSIVKAWYARDLVKWNKLKMAEPSFCDKLEKRIQKQFQSILIPTYNSFFDESEYLGYTKETSIGVNRLTIYPLVISKKAKHYLTFIYQEKGEVPFSFVKKYFDEVQDLITKSYERILANKELEVAKKEAEKANEFKDAFVANVSHEIRTPLNAILGHAQLLYQEDLDEKAKKSLKVINSSGKHLLTLLNEILQLSRLEGDAVKVNMEVCNLLNLIVEVKEIFNIQIEQKKLKCKLIYPPELPEIIQADSYKIRQILINLISNAIKFTKQGTITIRVEFQEQAIQISVEDTGVGIEKSQQERIFEQFEKTEKHGNANGIGLGLSISRKLSRLMKGQLQVESKIGKGSKFTLIVPYAKPSLSSYLNYHTHSPKVVNFLSSDSEKAHILLVEDDHSSQKTTANLLNKVGYKVQVQSSAEEASKYIQENSKEIDLILLDVVLPGKSGIELIKELKKNTAWQAIPVIVLSGEAMPNQIDNALKQGADAFLSKPIEKGRLYGELQKHLNVSYEYKAMRNNNFDEYEELAKIVRSDLSEKQVKSILASINNGEISELKDKINWVKDERLLAFCMNEIENMDLEKVEKLFLSVKESKNK